MPHLDGCDNGNRNTTHSEICDDFVISRRQRRRRNDARQRSSSSVATGSGGRTSSVWNRLLLNGIAGGGLASGIFNDRFKLKIYSDWANHYLEKCNNERLIIDLHTDVTDGVLLADIIHAVTSCLVTGIYRSPTSEQQMTENVVKCMALLDQLGIDVQDVSAEDIRNGNVKSVLQLFFSLSRYKQQRKQNRKVSESGSNSGSPSSASAGGVDGPWNDGSDRNRLFPLQPRERHNDSSDVATTVAVNAGIKRRPVETDDESRNCGGEVGPSDAAVIGAGIEQNSNAINNNAINGNLDPNAQLSRLPNRRVGRSSRLPTCPAISRSTEHLLFPVSDNCTSQAKEKNETCVSRSSNYCENNNPEDKHKLSGISRKVTDYTPEQAKPTGESHVMPKAEESVTAAATAAATRSSMYGSADSHLEGRIHQKSLIKRANSGGKRPNKFPTGSHGSAGKTKLVAMLPPNQSQQHQGNRLVRSSGIVRGSSATADDVITNNRKSFYDNVDMTSSLFAPSSLSAAAAAASRRRKPAAAISRLAVSATSLIGMLGGGPPTPMQGQSSNGNKSGYGSGTTTKTTESDRQTTLMSTSNSCDDILTTASANHCTECSHGSNSAAAGTKPHRSNTDGTITTSMLTVPELPVESNNSAIASAAGDGPVDIESTSAKEANSDEASPRQVAGTRSSLSLLKPRGLSIPVRSASNPSSVKGGLVSPSFLNNTSSALQPSTAAISPGVIGHGQQSATSFQFGTRSKNNLARSATEMLASASEAVETTTGYESSISLPTLTGNNDLHAFDATGYRVSMDADYVTSSFEPQGDPELSSETQCDVSALAQRDDSFQLSPPSSSNDVAVSTTLVHSTEAANQQAIGVFDHCESSANSTSASTTTVNSVGCSSGSSPRRHLPDACQPLESDPFGQLAQEVTAIEDEQLASKKTTETDSSNGKTLSESGPRATSDVVGANDVNESAPVAIESPSSLIEETTSSSKMTSSEHSSSERPATIAKQGEEPNAQHRVAVAPSSAVANYIQHEKSQGGSDMHAAADDADDESELGDYASVPPPMSGSFTTTSMVAAATAAVRVTHQNAIMTSSSSVSDQSAGIGQSSSLASGCVGHRLVAERSGSECGQKPLQWRHQPDATTDSVITAPIGTKNHRRHDVMAELCPTTVMSANVTTMQMQQGHRKLPSQSASTSRLYRCDVKPMLAISEAPEIGSMSPVERSFYEMDKADERLALGERDNQTHSKESCSALFGPISSSSTVFAASAAAISSKVSPTQPILSGSVPVVKNPGNTSAETKVKQSKSLDFTGPTAAICGRMPAAKLTRSSSDRTPKSPTRSPTPPSSSTTDDTDPWWKATDSNCPTETSTTAAGAACPASAGRSSTLPRTVKDSVELRARLTATAPVTNDGSGDVEVWKTFAAGESGAQHEAPTGLSELGLLANMVKSKSDDCRQRNSSSSSDEHGRHDGRLASKRHPEDYDSPNVGVNNLKQKTSAEKLTPMTSSYNALTIIQQPPPPKAALAARQSSADGERLSNYGKVSHVLSPSSTTRMNQSLTLLSSAASSAGTTRSHGVSHQVPMKMKPKRPMQLPDNAKSSNVACGQDKPVKYRYERWLAADGSSTENIAVICNDDAGETSSMMSSGEQDQTQWKLSRRPKLPRSADDLYQPPTTSNGGKNISPTESTTAGPVSRPHQPSLISVNSPVGIIEDGFFSSSGGGDRASFPRLVTSAMGGGSHWYGSDSGNYFQRAEYFMIGGPGTSNSVPRGISLCVSAPPYAPSVVGSCSAVSPAVGLVPKPFSTTSCTSSQPINCLTTTSATPAATRSSPASATSASCAFCTACSATSPKRSLSCRDDDWHGSMLSLISTTSSVYSSTEEKQAQEVRKLKRELDMAQDKISTLTTQLSTNVHVVVAFEKSLANMTQRLQKLATASEQKDSELTQLKMTLLSLQQQSRQQLSDCSPDVRRRAHKLLLSSDSADLDRLAAIEALSLASTGLDSGTGSSLSSLHAANVMQHRQQLSSCQTAVSTNGDVKKQSKINWLKMSLTKAFQKSRRRNGTSDRPKKSKSALAGRPAGGAWSDTECEAAASSVRSSAEARLSAEALSMPNSPSLNAGRPRGMSSGSVQIQLHGDEIGVGSGTCSVPATPCVNDLRKAMKIDSPSPTRAASRQQQNKKIVLSMSKSTPPPQSASTASTPGSPGLSRAVSAELLLVRLQQQLREKDLKLTDVRLEALTSAHQLDSLRDAMNRLKGEIASLKSENERMRRVIIDQGIDIIQQQPARDDSSSVSGGTEQMTPLSGSGILSTSLQRPSSNSSSLDVDRQSTSPKRMSLSDPMRIALDTPTASSSLPKKGGHRITLSVERIYSGSEMTSYQHRYEVVSEAGTISIGVLDLHSSTNWQALDTTVRRTFKKHLKKLDPGLCLGLGGSSVMLYRVGEIVRCHGSTTPDLLPCGYLVGDSNNIVINLKGPREGSVDALAFETLVPKAVVQSYVSLLCEHRRVIICGPTGTGKTYLARRLAETLVLMSGRELSDQSGVIATFNVDQKSGRELRQYLATVADQCLAAAAGPDTSLVQETNLIQTGPDGDFAAATVQGNTSTIAATGNSIGRRSSSSSNQLPVVIILDNLQHVGPASMLADAFASLLGVHYKSCPYIIGTMVQTSATSGSSGSTRISPTSSPSTSPAVGNHLLQLHHNFRWIMYVNHSEPVAGFLGRYLQRNLLAEEIRWASRSANEMSDIGPFTLCNSAGKSGRHYDTGTSFGDSVDLMKRIIDWLPRMWQHVNRFIESRCGTGNDVTIGPRLFLSCPMDPEAARLWFTDLWNYSIIPYLIEALRDTSTAATQVSSALSTATPVTSTAGRQHVHKQVSADWQDPTDWVVCNYPWPTMSAGQQNGVGHSARTSASPYSTITNSFRVAGNTSAAAGVYGIARPPSLLRLRPEDFGYSAAQPALTSSAADDSCLATIPTAESDVTEIDAGDLPAISRAPLSDNRWQSGSDARCVDPLGKYDENDSGELLRAAPLMDPLTSMLLRLQEAAGSASPAPSLDDCSSEASTGSASAYHPAAERLTSGCYQTRHYEC